MDTHRDIIVWNNVEVEILPDTIREGIKKIRLLKQAGVDIADPDFNPYEWLVAMNGPDRYFFDEENKVYLVR